MLIDPGGTKLFCSLSTFFGASCNIKYVVRAAKATDPGGQNVLSVLRCLSVHLMI